MSIINSDTDIAADFYELAALLDLDNANPFRVRAYRNAARTIENLPIELADMIAQGQDLTEISGIGKDLAQKIIELVNTGKLPLLDELHKKIPVEIDDLMHIPDLGPKRIKQLYEKLNIKTLADLKQALENGKISKLDGFGDTIAARIQDAVQKKIHQEKRITYHHAKKALEPLLAYLEQMPQIKTITVAGSFRRGQDTVGDLDILAVTTDGKKAIDHFAKYSSAIKIMSQGEAKATIILRSGLQVDFRIIEAQSFGAALQYFTGSKAHNIDTRKIAVNKNLKLNEYGVFKKEKVIASKTEKEIYQAIDLEYIEPELRENRGEVEAAQQHKLPKLITLADIKGDLHCHTNTTDGHDTIEAMAQAAQQLGYEYMAITDHSQHVTIAGGMGANELKQQIKAVDKLNTKLKNFRILKSVEVDILEDGTLDLPDSILKELDFTVCAIHYKFNLSRDKQTERILRAMDNKYFNIFAHPTGRLINIREPYNIDMEKIIHAAKDRNCILEINSQPERMDLTDIHCKMAKDIGVKLAISTDSHSTATLDYMQYGINQARRGWIEAKDVINTLPLKKLLQLFSRY